MGDDVVRSVRPLGFPWQTVDPFLFCVFHDDAYPEGDGALAPRGSLKGRDIGQDFSRKDGWSMYHGDRVPGFPQHPHRGFETVTIVRKGLVDHSDSLGATARFGGGDVQWLTAGRGIVHSEMFPLVDEAAPNPLELFQIWLNLPARDKMVDPYFSMFWGPKIPALTVHDDAGRATQVSVVAGQFRDARALAPPPNSWASRDESDVAILTLKLDPGATLSLAAARPETRRNLYFFRGSSLSVGQREVPVRSAVEVHADRETVLRNGPETAEVLVLQGRPIGEPVANHGPFVMNTRAELITAFEDYQRTRFGGWPFADDAPVHPKDRTRFARHADGRVEEAE